MAPKIEFTDQTYEYKTSNNQSKADEQVYMNSAFDKVRESEGGRVESQSEVTPAPVPPVQNQAASASTESFLGYTVDELRKYLKESCSGYDLDNMKPQQIINLAEKRLNEEIELYNKQLMSEDFRDSYIFTAEEQQIFDKIFPGDEGVKKAIIEAHFDVGEVFHAIKEIAEEWSTHIDCLTPDILHQIYDKKCDVCQEDENDEGSALDAAILNMLKEMAEADTIEKKKQIFVDFINKFVISFNAGLQVAGLNGETDIGTAVVEMLKDTLKRTSFSLDIKQAILASLGEFPPESHLDTLTAIVDDCNNDNEKLELISSIPIQTLQKVDKSVLEYIYDFYMKILSNEGANGEIGTDLSEIDGSIQKEGQLDDSSKAAFERLKEGMKNFIEATAGRQDINMEEQIKILLDAYRGKCGDDAYYEIIEQVHSDFEQHPDWFQGVDLTHFQELMNNVTHGNYEDILRGDGVHSPFNMPEGNGSQGGIPDGGYDQSSGGYYVDPSFNYELQNAYIFSLQQGLYMSSNQSMLPQRVVDNTPAQETSTVSSNPSVIRNAQECKEFLRNNANGVRDFLTGKVEGLSESVATVIIEKYKTLGKEQADLLAVSKQEFFTRLQRFTKISAVRNFFASGGKGNNVDRTRAMQEMLDEDEEKKKKEAC